MMTTLSRLLIVAGAAALLIALGFQAAAAWLIVLGAVLVPLLPARPAGRRPRRFRLPFTRRRRSR